MGHFINKIAKGCEIFYENYRFRGTYRINHKST